MQQVHQMIRTGSMRRARSGGGSTAGSIPTAPSTPKSTTTGNNSATPGSGINYGNGMGGHSQLTIDDGDSLSSMNHQPQHNAYAEDKSAMGCVRRACGCTYNLNAEQLEYDYEAAMRYQMARDKQMGTDPSLNKISSSPPPLPRIRARGEFYVDSFNEAPRACSFGTTEESGIWMNSGDQAGTIMAALVWLLMLYSIGTITLLAATEGIPPILGMIYVFFCTMALACHAKTSLTDPGSVPQAAVPIESQRQNNTSHSMCGQCQTFKPAMSHHCRICNRCVSKMDHHCPWMNNCVGAANLKHFLLFLLYTWTSAAFALCLFGWNYFFCAVEECTFNSVLVHLVRVMTVLCVGAFLFTSSMLMNVCYGLMTGIGTIDRLKKKATNTMSQSDEEPIPLKDVFGVAGFHTWPFPMDPVFEDYDRVMGYTNPQRLLREQQLMEQKVPQVDMKKTSTSQGLPTCELVPV